MVLWTSASAQGQCMNVSAILVVVVRFCHASGSVSISIRSSRYVLWYADTMGILLRLALTADAEPTTDHIAWAMRQMLKYTTTVRLNNKQTHYCSSIAVGDIHLYTNRSGQLCPFSHKLTSCEWWQVLRTPLQSKNWHHHFGQIRWSLASLDSALEWLYPRRKTGVKIFAPFALGSCGPRFLPRF